MTEISMGIFNDSFKKHTQDDDVQPFSVYMEVILLTHITSACHVLCLSSMDTTVPAQRIFNQLKLTPTVDLGLGHCLPA